MLFTTRSDSRALHGVSMVRLCRHVVVLYTVGWIVAIVAIPDVSNAYVAASRHRHHMTLYDSSGVRILRRIWSRRRRPARTHWSLRRVRRPSAHSSVVAFETSVSDVFSAIAMIIPESLLSFPTHLPYGQKQKNNKSKFHQSPGLFLLYPTSLSPLSFRIFSLSRRRFLTSRRRRYHNHCKL